MPTYSYIHIHIYIYIYIYIQWYFQLEFNGILFIWNSMVFSTLIQWYFQL